VAGQAVKPLTHATGDGFVALPTGRNKTPFVLLARGDTLRIACVQLGNREAFPIAKGNFGKSRLQAIAVRRQTECRADEFHGFACTSERARYIVEISRVAPCALKQPTQNFTATGGLGTTLRVQRNVATALQTAGYVPVGFSVTDVVDSQRRHRR